MNKCFIFDINKCTGCGACVIACTQENNQTQGKNWRQVYHFNEYQHPALPCFTLSLACNHCLKPVCKENCPANAYSKDIDTGAVTIDPEKCMGCKYCTWACPYDAPKYNSLKGITEKCDFCKDRIIEGENPSCTISCPTGALQLGDYHDSEETISVKGFTEIGIKPSIEFIKFRKGNSPPENILSKSDEKIDEIFSSSLNYPKPKITLKSEWTLVIFTTIAYILVAMFTASLSTDIHLDPYIFLGVGVLSVLLSTTHLGKKVKAYRAIFNFKSSWLSREIFFFSLFLFMSGVFLMLFPQAFILGWASSIIGFMTLFSIDKIYQIAMKVSFSNFHSAHVLFNGFYLTGILLENKYIYLMFGSIKIVLYIYRKYYLKKCRKAFDYMVSFLRLGLGFIIPFLLIFANSIKMENLYILLGLSIVVGELIDRCEYYSELDVVTPKKQIIMDLETLLKSHRK